MSTESVSAPDNTEIFQQLESYPWENDSGFQAGLSAILGEATDAVQIRELSLRAQVFYLSRKKSIPIDFDAYKAYLASKSAEEPTSTSIINSTSLSPPTETEAQAETPPPPPLAVQFPSESSPRTIQDSTSPITTSKPTDAPYPATFAEIVHLITTGAPIPGIKEIPSITLPEKATKPLAKKRRKPWETDVPEEVVQGLAEGTFGDRRDEIIVQELPE